MDITDDFKNILKIVTDSKELGYKEYKKAFERRAKEESEAKTTATTEAPQDTEASTTAAETATGMARQTAENTPNNGGGRVSWGNYPTHATPRLGVMMMMLITAA